MPLSQPGSLNAMYGNPKRVNIAERNGQWKGDKVGYKTLHWWIRKRLPIPNLCENCKAKPPNDLANITGIYNRDLSNWKYLCRSCHMKTDGRMNNLTGCPLGFKQTEETIKKMKLVKRLRDKNGRFTK